MTQLLFIRMCLSVSLNECLSLSECVSLPGYLSCLCFGGSSLLSPVVISKGYSKILKLPVLWWSGEAVKQCKIAPETMGVAFYIFAMLFPIIHRTVIDDSSRVATTLSPLIMTVRYLQENSLHTHKCSQCTNQMSMPIASCIKKSGQNTLAIVFIYILFFLIFSIHNTMLC